MALRPGATNRQHAAIALILATFVALGFAYVRATPVFEAPDEPAHYLYARHIVTHRTLPPLIVSESIWEQGQMHQPPLYYMLGALLTGRGSDTEIDALYPRNPFAALGEPSVPGNKNAVLHLTVDSPAHQAVVRSVGRLRALSLALSTITVLLTYLIARRLVPGDGRIALGAAAVTAFNPQFLFISASANNDLLVTMLSTLALYLAVCIVTGDDHSVRTPLLLGAVVGLAAISKIAGLATAALVPAAYGMALWLRRERGRWTGLVRPTLLAATAALVTGGWWYARNALLYADPLTMRSYTRIFAVYSEPLPLAHALRVMIESFTSYWGVFGWMNVLLPEPLYGTAWILCALGALGAVAWIMRLWRSARATEPTDTAARETLLASLLCALWVAIMLALLLRWSQSITRTQGRLLFPAIAPISLFIIIGLTSWVPRRAGSALVVIMSAALLALSMAMPSTYITPTYAVPPRITADDLPETVQRVDVRYADDHGETLLTLLGYEITFVGPPGGNLHLRLYWQALRPLDTDYILGIQILGLDGARIGGIDTHPAMGRYPTRMWQPGEVLVDDSIVPLDRDAVVPVAAAIRVGVYDQDPGHLLHVTDPQGHDLGTSARIAYTRVAPLQSARYQPTHPLHATLGDRTTLLGYDVTIIPSAESIELVLYWECLTPMEHAYTIFAHLMDGEGHLLAQADNQPMNGAFPTVYWQPGDRVRDVHMISLSTSDIPAGPLQLRAGLYRVDTGERLLRTDSATPTDFITIPVDPLMVDRTADGS